MKRMKRNERGFTLIEVLVAVALMAIALAGIATMGISSMQADTLSNRQSAATALARAKLEKLRVLRRSNAEWANGSHGPETVFAGNSEFQQEWEVVRNYVGAGGVTFNGLARVTVWVSWDDGSPQEVSLTSFF